MFDFNINDNVEVRLTDHGRQLLREDHEKLFARYSRPPEYSPPEEDKDGWSRWQLWQLMQAFGAHLGNGAQLPFETNIRIISES